MSEQVVPGLSRVLSEDGGGVEIVWLCERMLACVHAHGHITLNEALVEACHTHGHKGARLQAHYGGSPDEARRAFARALLDQLTLRDVLRESEAGRWTPGPAFQLDVLLDIAPSLNGDWHRTIVRSTPLEPTQDELLDEQWRVDSRRDLAMVAQRLYPHSTGLRGRVDMAVEKVKQSVRERGILPQFPQLWDQHGRLLDGWQRRYAEADLKEEGVLDADESWPRQIVVVQSDAHALGVAVAANLGTPFDPADIEKLEELGLKWLKPETMRARIEAALRASEFKRDPRDIALEIGCSSRFAYRVRQVLLTVIEPGSITVNKPGSERDQEKWDRVQRAWLEAPQATDAIVAERAGCTEPHANKVRAELEALGLVGPRPRHGHSPGRRRDVDKRARAQEAWRSDPWARAEAISKRAGCSASLAREVRQELEQEGQLTPKAAPAPKPKKEQHRSEVGIQLDAALRENHARPNKEIARLVGAALSTVHRHRHMLEEQGVIPVFRGDSHGAYQAPAAPSPAETPQVADGGVAGQAPAGVTTSLVGGADEARHQRLAEVLVALHNALASQTTQDLVDELGDLCAQGCPPNKVREVINLMVTSRMLYESLRTITERFPTQPTTLPRLVP